MTKNNTHKSGKRFFTVWIFSSIVMYLLFYVWHGVVLNDFLRLNYPKKIFLIFAPFAYVVIGFVVMKFYESKFIEKYYNPNSILKGAVKGAMCGFFLFLISTVAVVSFNTGSDIKNTLLNLTWQMIEQGTGGLIIGFFYMSRKQYTFKNQYPYLSTHNRFK